jgi:hypothetical protein
MDDVTLGYAVDLARRYGLRYQNDELWRPKGKDSGIHEAGKAIDVPVDQNSPLGRRIIADAHARGFYTYTEPHGSGPHVHIETHRNPDGTPKGRR